MHYDYQCSILGEPLLGDDEGHLLSDRLPDELSVTTNTAPLDASLITFSLLHTTYSSWRLMFHTRPRIRFSGVYISTVNYVRPGASSANQVSWNTPVHIVTYYRYLRFFRDGTVLSLLRRRPAPHQGKRDFPQYRYCRRFTLGGCEAGASRPMEAL
jgi:F-box protein 9